MTRVPSYLWSERLERYRDKRATIVNDFVEHRINLVPYYIILLILGEVKKHCCSEVNAAMQKVYSAHKGTAGYTMMDLQSIIFDIRLSLKEKTC